jgi:hypothetical protein
MDNTGDAFWLATKIDDQLLLFQELAAILLVV